MKKTLFLFLVLLIVATGVVIQQKYHLKSESPKVMAALENISSVTEKSSPVPSPTPNMVKLPGQSANINLPTYVSQTFNNCGPANLTMILAKYGTNLSQQKLAEDLRPFNNPKGGVDDKEVFSSELAQYAQKLGYKALVRPNGTEKLLKTLITNGYPVIVTQWLHPNEDIGHYRIVKGFDDTTQKFSVDDTYTGPNQTISYTQFNEIWKPFNYNYLLIYPAEKESQIAQILDGDYDQNAAYQNAIKRSNAELETNPNDFYAHFNLSTANYYLGNFDESVKEYEKSASGLPPRMLWYQLEPLYSMQQTGEDEKVLSLSDKVINNGNLAYADLYQLKGEIYLKQGKTSEAREMFEKALYYNKNYDKPKESLVKLEQY